MIFVVLIVVIISGVFVECMKFLVFILFVILWLLFVYVLVVYWVWGVGGWFCELGVIDFVGGNVVYILLGVVGLVLVFVVGKWKNVDVVVFYNLLLIFLGGMLIWFGWFGFNVGSFLIINSVVMMVFINMNIVVVIGIIGWFVVEWIINKKFMLFGVVLGVIVGFVVIILVCGFVILFVFIVIGFIGGVVCFWGIFLFKKKIGYDDVLDVFGFYGIGGMWGGIVIGLFVIIFVNDVGVNGLFYGDLSLFWK